MSLTEMKSNPIPTQLKSCVMHRRKDLEMISGLLLYGARGGAVS